MFSMMTIKEIIKILLRPSMKIDAMKSIREQKVDSDAYMINLRSIRRNIIMIKDGNEAKKDFAEYLANCQIDTDAISRNIDEMGEIEPEMMSKMQDEVESAIEYYYKLKEKYDDDEYDYYINILKGFLEICKEGEEEDNVVSLEDYKKKHSKE